MMVAMFHIALLFNGRNEKGNFLSVIDLLDEVTIRWKTEKNKRM